MSNFLISMPINPFSTPRAFKSVANGKIYVGVQDTDPVNPLNRIPIFIENEDGSQIQVPQPIAVNAGGFPVYNGQISKFVTRTNYSMAVYDAYNVQQYYWPDLSRIDPDAFSRQLMSKRVYAIDFGQTPDGTNPTEETKTIQRAIDYVYSLGGGVVDLGPFTWTISASSLNETYDNNGVSVSSSSCGIILRKRVSLVGQKGRTKILSADQTINVIGLVAPNGNLLSGFEVDGGWTSGMPGAGHGIFQFGTAGGADISCKNTVFEDLYIHNVASYGIGIQNGIPQNVHLVRIRVDTSGADGLDLKARGDSVTIPYGNTVIDTWVSNHNLRVDGSAGIDIRGIWHLSGITITDFGGDATRSYTGIRFRTKPPASDPYQKAAARSTLTGFTVVPSPGAAALSLNGVECGSDDVHISDGVVEDCILNIVHNGNNDGSAIRGTVKGVTSVNARQYGFRNLVGCDGIEYIGCIDIGSVSAGFRIEGANCTAIGCSGSLSTSAAAAPTFLTSAGRHGDSYVSTERITDTIVAVSARGTGTDIAMRLVPKGAGNIAAHGSIIPDTPNTRYIGKNSLPFAGGFTQTAFTVTSDEHSKTPPVDITDEILDAAEEVSLVQYKYLDRVEEKGADGARWHFGAIAQRYVEAFERHGLDAHQFGFICYDEWSAYPAIIDEETGDELSAAIEAGSRYGIRYEEMLVLEAAVQRRKNDGLLARIEALESKLSQ